MANVGIPALVDISIPKHVKIQIVTDFEALMAEIGRKSMAGYSGQALFGSAFVQGNRLQFTTAMPLETMLKMSKMDRSKKKDNIREVVTHANRPVEPPHAKALRTYLMNTACQGDQFILPAFIFNYGVDLTDEDPVAQLVIFGSGDDSTTAWPAMLLMPAKAVLDTSDGAHRRSQVKDILDSSKVAEEQKQALRANSVDVKIVFEASRNNSHQDFADCGRAKTIAKSIITTYDVRDRCNRRTRKLVESVTFLTAYVDATANNVNLSGKSRKIWSMSAIRTCIHHINEHHPDTSLTEIEDKTHDLEKFFDELIRQLPQLRALDAVKKEELPSVTTGSLREAKGGDVLLRGIGMSIIARAFLHCVEHNINFTRMTKKLASINWHVLDIERGELPAGAEAYRAAVAKHANPLWSNLLVVGEDRFRISSSSEDADNAWGKVINDLDMPVEAAA